MSAKGVVLVVDDDIANIEILAEAMEPEHTVLFALTGEKALELVAKQMPDLVILDVLMPGMSGYEVCERLKRRSATAKIPVIFITALENAAEETRGLELGAVDYIAKPIKPAIVRVRVRNHLELKQSRDLLEKLSITDGLTGLANRRHFDMLLDAECRRLQRLREPLSLIMIDVDYFKFFNDTYGHPAGDACLKAVGGVIGRSVNRTQDMAARYGGEEFACILPETEQIGALKIAEVIMTGIHGLGIAHAGSKPAGHITASLGVVTVTCDPLLTSGEVIKKADEQLYLAKAEGRNRISWADISQGPGAGPLRAVK